MNLQLIFYSSLVFLGTLTQTSGQTELFGEDIFLTIFGLDSTPACEVCNDWTQVKTKSDTTCPFLKLSEDAKITVENLYFTVLHHLDHPNIPLNRNGVYLLIFCSFSVMLLWVLKVRKRKSSYGNWRNSKRLKRQEIQKHKNRKAVQKLFTRNGQDGDKLRKTKKQRPHMISKQGLMIMKKMYQGSEDSPSFDVIRQERCQFISPEPEFSVDNMLVFDLRERSDIPNTVMDALLCVERNCTKHPHNYIKKYGNKIVCNPEAFALNTDPKSYLTERTDSQDAEYNAEGDSVDVIKFDDLGPPCASSSFISDTSSTITTDNEDAEDTFDPFSYLDDTNSQNASMLQRYLEDSMTWFGGLYSYTRETSLRNFTIDGLNRSISRGLDDFDKSFDISETQKNLSFYGYESDSVIQLAVICFAKQMVGQIHHAWLQLGGNKTKKNLLGYNRNLSREVECSGCAVYNDSVYDE